MSVRIGIAGIAGRMGRLLAEEAVAAGATLAGGTLRPGSAAAPPPGVPVLPDAAALFAASEVVIDFTHASAAAAHAALAARTGRPLVLGTSGLSPVDEAAVAEAARRAPICYAANFAPGVNLVLAIAERMAAALPAEQYDAEIVEMHHRQKVDAPSGTAIALGRAVARGRGTTLEAAGRESGRDGHTGARKTGAIGFAALRGGQVVGEHTLLFAGASEHIALTHRSFDRRVYATGAVRAALWLVGRPPGLYGMKDVLGMG
ncbi:4-hydroxy-tetrahydrodipicolinate reductase [Caldovatus aquaticus]|uniref:4-hydroxy-tetrahydrodipicolinate reductase n=1 Tax=Caldovatus aquaticus TaxID=2865671 RepID=A0ABS7F2J2_9PROT|nr:4-hydroxy-tetrahydrodipicolinate reductase [Caldovatus aquaticus]MBW8269719.1 4-hydroxy-tetrahydrodipicolinate reductase [Caldovatus aquaticus]